MPRRAPLRTLRPPPGRPPRPTAGGSRRALTAAALAAALLLGAAPAGAGPAPIGPVTQVEPTPPAPTTEPGGAAADDAEAGDEVPLPPLGELVEISPALSDVALTSDGYDRVAAVRDGLAERRDEAAQREADEAETIAAAADRDEELTERIEAARERADRWEDEADRIDDDVRAVAVGSYMRGTGADVGPLFSLDTAAHDRAATSSITSEALAQRQVADLEHARSEGRRARSAETLSTAIRDGVRETLAGARIARAEARAEQQRLAHELVDATAALEDHRRLATVVGTDFPLVVLDAYWKASELMAVLSPGCGIQWWALAGIGKIESGHGTYRDSEVRADGSLTAPIIGIPLTGEGGTAAIGDSDGGLIDGDPTVDRAAGPMQFIPQTWMAYGIDGDGNGAIEIQNLYDAAASAARYLCAAAGSMADVGGLQRGYFAYNHSDAYVASVLAQAVRYGTEVQIEGVPLPPTPPPPPEPEPEPDPAAPVDGTTTTTTAPAPTPPHG